MSRHFKRLTLDSVNDVYDDLQCAKRQLHNDITYAQRQAVLEADRHTRERIDTMRRNLERSMDSKISNVERSTNRQINELDERHRQSIKKLSDQVYNDMGKFSKKVYEDMNNLSEHVYQDLNNLQKWTTEEVSRIDQHISGLEREIDVRFRSQQSQIDNLNSGIQSLFERLQHEENYMDKIVQSTADLLSAVEKRTSVDRFTPIEASRIRRRLAELQNSPTPAAARIATATEICNRIWEMEEDAVREKMKYDALHNLALGKVQVALEIMNSNRIIKAERDGEVSDIEADYWTKGEYQKVADELQKLYSELRNISDPNLTEERIKIIMERIAILDAQVKLLASQAVERGILSENRVVVTQDIIDAMIRQGYQVKTEKGKDAVGYMGGEEERDMREGVFAILEDGSGEEITVIVMPNEGSTQNEVVFHRNDERPISDKEYIRHLKNIKQQIERSGHKLGNLQSPSDGGNEIVPELTAGRVLSSKGASGKLKQRMQ